jgi:hypothetical protein
MKVGAASRGSELLLAHCEALGTLDDVRPSSYERLADSIGGPLARLLVFALSGDHGMRPRRDRGQRL